ncbi:hypothetical protein GCM10011354_29960 [Egicoccus halophilus]|uniref:PKD domain-containing protein n=2 Tax=Egicoccus halophilus TaxID=1670830 RepID=A0A8J3ACM3_9ACTN|nr:hypothetical protein GCM10011354_29960 [Egicoccus halophilus]
MRCSPRRNDHRSAMRVSSVLLLLAVLHTATPAGTATASTATDPVTATATGTVRRAYTDDSPWNTRIPAHARVHPDSRTFLRSFETAASDGHRRRLTSDPTQYTFPLYRVGAATPTRRVTLTGTYSEVVDQVTTRTRRAPVLSIPIPANAQPSPGTDASVVIWNPATGDEWGFWEFTNHGNGTFSARNGYHYNTNFSGVPPTAPNRFGSRGAGVPYFAGLVRRDEIDAGRIDHALAFAYDYPSPEFVWPATKSDGIGTIGRDVPEGARIRLDPTYTEADFTAWGLSREGRIIARALQQYGMYTIDKAGRPKIMIEDEQTAAWKGTITASTVSRIPWDAFQVLDWRTPKAPVAALGAGTTVAPGTLVTLDASGSYAPDGGTITAYQWTAPTGTTLTNPTNVQATWNTRDLAPGTYTFTLRVRDTTGTWSTPASITHTIAVAQLPTVLQQQTFGAVNATGASGVDWLPGANEELLTVVALRPASTNVTQVTGNGLTWTRVVRHRDVQGELAVEIWRASGALPTPGPVSVRTDRQAGTLNAQALRMSPSRVLSSAGADTGALDTRFPALALSAGTPNTLALGVHVGRATPFTPDAGLTEIGRHAVGDGGGNVRTTLLATPLPNGGRVRLGGSQSTALDWVMGGIVLGPR